MFKELFADFRWWMIPLALVIILVGIGLLLWMSGPNVLPHEYAVH